VIRPGEEGGSPTGSPPDLDVSGGDAALAQAVAASPGALISFHPDDTSDLARAVGLAPGAAQGTALPLDVLALAAPTIGPTTLAANMCVLGTAPDRLRRSSPAFDLEIEIDGKPWFAGRATTAVIATGQFLRGVDLVPRGHPGDGKAEIQVYELRRRERRPMRARLPTGTHVPHPRIRQRGARTVVVRARPLPPCEVDGVAAPPVADLSIEVRPGAYRLLI
jgi:hypothetical protein